ncbi:DoxX family protein [Aestuariibius sp. 2305UL40-4]|uniref:DoxX family protein n=1 Tax=Aestuariibius violaceus TaxID=3234132 RepID=UPI00345E480F
MPLSLFSTLLLHAGRVILASLFILGGLNKIADPQASVVMMEATGLPLPGLAIYAVILLELGLGLAVALGGAVASGRLVAPAALALTLYTLAVNVFFHPFWAMEGVQAQTELSLFFKNVSVMGGLLAIAGLYLDRSGAPDRP